MAIQQYDLDTAASIAIALNSQLLLAELYGALSFQQDVVKAMQLCGLAVLQVGCRAGRTVLETDW